MVQNAYALPPSGRDFEVYRMLHVEGCSTREVAQACQLSQTRVCQIAEKVAAYITAVAPAKDDQRREQRLFVAENVAAMRVAFLYGSAVQGWRDSRGSLTTVRQLNSPTQMPVTVQTTRPCVGEGRYLMLAGRLALLGSKLPAAQLELHPEGDDDGTQQPGDAGPSAEECQNPLDGDCSLVEVSATADDELTTEDRIVKYLTDEVYRQPSRAAASSGETGLATVHRSVRQAATAVQPPATVPLFQEDCETGDIVTFAPVQTGPGLSRQERRARQKLLERKLRRG